MNFSVAVGLALFFLSPFVGAFGVAFVRLLWCEPRKLAFIAVGGTAIFLGSKGNKRVRRILGLLRQRQGHVAQSVRAANS